MAFLPADVVGSYMSSREMLKKILNPLPYEKVKNYVPKERIFRVSEAELEIILAAVGEEACVLKDNEENYYVIVEEGTSLDFVKGVIGVGNT